MFNLWLWYLWLLTNKYSTIIEKKINLILILKHAAQDYIIKNNN